jgi:hypothetical protein
MFVQVLVVHVDGARWRLWTAATNGPTVHLFIPQMIYEYGKTWGTGLGSSTSPSVLPCRYHSTHVSWRLDNGPVGGPVPQRLSRPIATIKNKIGILTVQMCLSRCITPYHCCTVIEGHSCTIMTLENSWNNVANRAAEVLGTQTWWPRQRKCGRRAKPWRQGPNKVSIVGKMLGSKAQTLNNSGLK